MEFGKTIMGGRRFCYFRCCGDLPVAELAESFEIQSSFFILGLLCGCLLGFLVYCRYMLPQQSWLGLHVDPCLANILLSFAGLCLVSPSVSSTLVRRPLQFLCALVIFMAVGCIQRSVLAQSSANPFLPENAIDDGWPTIRGPNFDGRSPEVHLADAWPDEGPPVLWTRELGQGYSSFVIKDNRAYTQYQTLAGQFVLCLDADTGKTIWRYRYDWPFEASGLYPGPRSTPTLYGDHVYFTTPTGSAGCLNLNGSLVWSQNVKVDLDGKGTDFGYACSPIVVDGKVLLPIGGRGASMVALDASDGSLIWKSGDASASYVPALPITVDGQEQVIGYLEHELVAVDQDSGRQLWSKHLSNGYDEHSAWPIYSEPYLWTSSPFQAGSQLWELSGGKQGSTCQLVWQNRIMSNDVSSSVLVDGFIYGFDLAEAQSKAHRPSRGVFRCIELLTGKVRWSNGVAKSRRSTDFETNRTAQIIGHASILVADRKLFFLTDLGDLIMAKVNPDSYVELGRTRVLGGEISWATPALDRGRLILRNRSRAVCLFVGKPELSKPAARQASLTVADIPQGTVRDYSALLGVEPEYAMDPPTMQWLQCWFAFGLAILVTAGVIARSTYIFFRGAISADSVRLTFWIAAAFLGIVTGSPASLIMDDFVFTWPIVLFIVFQVTIYQCEIGRVQSRQRAKGKQRTDTMIAVIFVATCFAYFFTCRRLSLPTEWLFLGGFFAAAPILLASRWVAKNWTRLVGSWQSGGNGWLFAEWLLTLFAFSAFFWSSVGLLMLKYNISRF